MVSPKINCVVVAALLAYTTKLSHALSANIPASRRAALGWLSGGVTGWAVVVSEQEQTAQAAGADDIPDTFNVDDYLRTGQVMNPMGVSGQAGELVRRASSDHATNGVRHRDTLTNGPSSHSIFGFLFSL
jgi:hypothetical protein